MLSHTVTLMLFFVFAFFEKVSNEIINEYCNKLLCNCLLFFLSAWCRTTQQNVNMLIKKTVVKWWDKNRWCIHLSNMYDNGKEFIKFSLSHTFLLQIAIYSIFPFFNFLNLSEMGKNRIYRRICWIIRYFVAIVLL